MVFTEGLERLFVIFMLGVGERFELFGITPWAAAVLWRPHAYCIEDERICQVRAGQADALDLDAVIPGIAKVVEILEGLAPRIRQDLGESGLTGVERPVEAIFRIRDAKAGLPEAHFPQVRVRPGEGGLDDGVQTVEPDIERHLQRSADGRRDIVQRNLHPHDSAVVHAAFSRSLVSFDACQFHGKKSSIRLIG